MTSNKGAITINKSEWPNDFDFENDPVCQKIFKPFIEDQLERLRAYDQQRITRLGYTPSYLFYEHAYSAAEDVQNTCINLGLGKKIAHNMFWATLIHDIGKPELSPEIWDYRQSPSKEIKAKKRTHTTLGGKIMHSEIKDEHKDHPFFKLALDIIENHHERLDGKGPQKRVAAQLSMPVRLASIIEDYDGRTHLRPHHQQMGIGNSPPEVFTRMEEKCIGWFDETIYEAFKAIKINEYKQKISLRATHGLHDGPF